MNSPEKPHEHFGRAYPLNGACYVKELDIKFPNRTAKGYHAMIAVKRAVERDAMAWAGTQHFLLTHRVFCNYERAIKWLMKWCLTNQYEYADLVIRVSRGRMVYKPR
jgi:hypothetical protein